MHKTYAFGVTKCLVVLLLISIVINLNTIVLLLSKDNMINTSKSEYTPLSSMESRLSILPCNHSEMLLSSNQLADQNWCDTMRWKPICWTQGQCTGGWPEFLFHASYAAYAYAADSIHHNNQTIFLEASVHSAGLGHSLMSLNGLIQIAIKHRLTLRVNMDAAGSGHGLSSDFANSIFQNHFYAALPLASCYVPEIISVGYADLASIVTNIRQTMKSSCVVIQLRDSEYPTTEDGFNVCGFRSALRLLLPTPSFIVKDSMTLMRIAMHLRRGDILNSLDLIKLRGVPNQCAANLLLQVLAVAGKFVADRVYSGDIMPDLESNIKSTIEPIIEVIIHAEESRSISAVIDLDGSTSDFGISSVLGEKRILESTTAMMQEVLESICSSHILITGKSGFSHVLALFCKNTVVVAVPFWHSYSYFRNVLVVEEDIADNQVTMVILGSVLTFPAYTFRAEALQLLLQALFS